jgi:hypothetical protein
VGDDVFIDSETLLVTDFVNLKIKPAQSFGGAHRDRVCVFIGVSTHTCMSIYICTMFLKKKIHRCSREAFSHTHLITIIPYGPCQIYKTS